MNAKFALTIVLLGIIGLCQCVPRPPAPIAAQETGDKKLIYFGWGSPDPLYMREHWRQMEEMPFDGVGIRMPADRRSWQEGKRDTDNQLGWKIMGKRAFRIEDFRATTEDVKAAKWRKFTDNFLPVMLSAAQSTTGLNWFDDERWRIVANNFEVLAKVAAEGNYKGMIFDPEHYNYALFDYPAQRRQLEKPFEAYTQIARQRGREVMRAITGTMPKVVILSLLAHSYPMIFLKSIEDLPHTRYNLLPAFYDGLLEAMPSGATLVDGYEPAYNFKERRQFVAAHRKIQEAVKLSAVPEHYRKKLKAGFGLWIDYKKNPNYFSPQEFQRAVTDALEISDKYVWIYSHGPRFFPPYAVDPSYIEALAAAREANR